MNNLRLFSFVSKYFLLNICNHNVNICVVSFPHEWIHYVVSNVLFWINCSHKQSICLFFFSSRTDWKCCFISQIMHWCVFSPLWRNICEWCLKVSFFSNCNHKCMVPFPHDLNQCVVSSIFFRNIWNHNVCVFFPLMN